MKKQTVMIVGLGELGGALLEYLVRVPNLACRLVTADIDAESGQAKTMAARQGAAFWDTIRRSTSCGSTSCRPSRPPKR